MVATGGGVVVGSTGTGSVVGGGVGISGSSVVGSSNGCEVVVSTSVVVSSTILFKVVVGMSRLKILTSTSVVKVRSVVGTSVICLGWTLRVEVVWLSELGCVSGVSLASRTRTTRGVVLLDVPFGAAVILTGNLVVSVCTLTVGGNFVVDEKIALRKFGNHVLLVGGGGGGGLVLGLEVFCSVVAECGGVVFVLGLFGRLCK